MKRNPTEKKIRKAINELPGAAIDAADKDKTTAALEKERTETLGCNPNGDIK